MKIGRDAFLYLAPKGRDSDFAQCSDCVFFTKGLCVLHGKDVKIKPGASCGLFVKGDSLGLRPVKLVTPKESGLVDRKVRCENCILPGMRVAGDFRTASKAFYSGYAVKIRTRAGSTLAVTINHPVFSKDGRVPAGQIQKGDYLACDLRNSQRGTRIATMPTFALVGDDVKYAPAPVEQVFEAFEHSASTGHAVSSVKVPSLLDFHGDGQFLQGDIEIIRADCSLLSAGYTQTTQCERQGIFSEATGKQTPMASGGAGQIGIDGVLLSASSQMGSLDPSPSSSGVGHLTPFFGQASAYYPAATFVSFGTSYPPSGSEGFPLFPQRNTGFYEDLLDTDRTDFVSRSKGINRMPCDIEFDDVVSVERFHYSGPVFDFESSTGYMVAESIYISNCRYYNPNRSTCQLYERLNKLMPQTFDLDTKVEAQACCNANMP